ncbi:MAG: cytochrome c [Phycisphaerales bacterium]|nr:cytochrome c [Phycisphaerales bacterium]
MPRWLIYFSLIVVCAAMIPPVLIARARTSTTANRRIHLIQDMDNQFKFRAQQTNPVFDDGRAMRQPVEGTVARGDLRADAHFDRGVSGNDWATTFPAGITVDRAFVERGRERFTIYCTPCHGIAGYGDGIVHQRAELRQASIRSYGTTWVAPKSLHEDLVRVQPVGQIYNTVTNGIRTMSGYKAQVPTLDRWAIVAYVKALQRSQHATLADVDPADQAGLR